jgi:hypothetical protein
MVPATVRARLLAAAAAVLLATVAAGCGGDGDGEETVEPTVTAEVFFPLGDAGPECDEVLPLERTVSSPDVLRGTLEALLEGPTAAEREEGFGGWFSQETAGLLRSARISEGVAYVDFEDFRRVIPNASASCGSALLLAQLDRTVTQFPTVDRAVYSFEGDSDAFYEWLQRSAP